MTDIKTKEQLISELEKQVDNSQWAEAYDTALTIENFFPSDEYHRLRSESGNSFRFLSYLAFSRSAMLNIEKAAELMPEVESIYAKLPDTEFCAASTDLKSLIEKSREVYRTLTSASFDAALYHADNEVANKMIVNPLNGREIKLTLIEFVLDNNLECAERAIEKSSPIQRALLGNIITIYKTLIPEYRELADQADKRDWNYAAKY